MDEPQLDFRKIGRKKSAEVESAKVDRSGKWLLVMLLLLPMLYVLLSYLEPQFAPIFRVIEWYRSLW